MENLEIEVKFHLKDIESMRRRILQLGFESMGRVFETNVRYEDHENTMIQKKTLLRLRQDEKARLTFKSMPEMKGKDFKVFKELEVEVNDMAKMSQILEALGFHPEQTYEKWREKFILDQTSLLLDRMPYGDFLEIEGQPNDIKRWAARLGLGWHRRILLNYLEIFEIITKKLNLKIKDVTFKNFETAKVDIAAFLDKLEAGH